jgi:hypothetical protein
MSPAPKSAGAGAPAARQVGGFEKREIRPSSAGLGGSMSGLTSSKRDEGDREREGRGDTKGELLTPTQLPKSLSACCTILKLLCPDTLQGADNVI